ncbi:trace amine-associated receptor 1-like [Sebastes umbrosus]|uniref:trace amine-associated receptor 1-like n=1 Tax=Sebastes umbrosus TaxID=72105 RepID=UPI00189D7C97|nr:trace amine-associated receptor 1-like [Sebastes umbrosus]
MTLPPICHWIKDFQTNHPQTVRLGPHTSSTLILSTGAPQGCVLRPLLYAVYTQDCTPTHPTNTIIKFADDTTVMNFTPPAASTEQPTPLRTLLILDISCSNCCPLIDGSGTPSTICVLLYIFLGSLCVVTICGNLLVIISIIYFKQLHTATNSLILSLAVADLLVGVVVFPFNMALSLSSCLYYEDLFCKVRGSFDITLSTASILNLCCISIDRYYAVCQPLNYRTKINVNAVVVMILGSWSVSVLVAIGSTIPGLSNEKCEENCFIDFLLATILGLIFSFYLPVIIMLCIYLKIFLVAQRQARSIQNTICQSTKSGATASKMERKATKTLAIVMGVFLMCWTPFFLCFTFQLLNHVSVFVPLFETLNWLALLNSMLIPFIYAFFYGWFRSAFRMIISVKIFQGDFTNTKLL